MAFDAVTVFATIATIVNFAALVDYSLRLVARIKDFSGRFEASLRLLEEARHTLPFLHATFRSAQMRWLDDRQFGTVHSIEMAAEMELERLEALLVDLTPRDEDSGVKSMWKAVQRIRREKEMEGMSIALDRRLRVLAMMPMGFINPVQDRWDQRPIRLLDTMNRPHIVPFWFYQTTEGFVTFLAIIFKDYPMPAIKAKFENGLFWIEERGYAPPSHPKRPILERHAILADDFEQYAKPGSVLAVVADDLSDDQCKVVRKPWEDRICLSLSEILVSAHWVHEERSPLPSLTASEATMA